ncbi:MAG: hypothetical protein A2087_13855 [Spirochaetes bacterium GWD1_61_31]|nr:MAG: hypothetical protein A2Y37_10380 [Spirochaetes bacterium GWB1_60_80]OHD33762.1 MAG: hypothetical protein A2004_09650 [Spirochaetes bacterium GWC1_61_12]OHD38988.1 MAG: hypothetical protein A2087_13855 [Spirochaetes bacterium GWD1_61_31]OHD43438.1 MAG: hypothetical protein A2Y35_11750 [Spirochaetes bacterium GWE1_60_18]OHD58969.1 MAG: hypothetical protein A2Y32_10540 [Spirochaetes bacterium GWF1_60_12]HAW86281.1 ABC transporter substrate-binding protein [Spirochaetaceae bacterium]
MKRTVIIFLALLALTGLLVTADTPPTIKVGGIFDLTGATGDVGAPYSLGVRDYIDTMNARGGVNGTRVELIWTDYRYNVAQATEFYNSQLKNKVVAIIGWGTGDTLALAPVVATDRIPFLSASYDESLTVTSRNPYNFVVGVTYSSQIRVILRHFAAANGRGAKIAIFHHASAFGESPLADAEAEAASLGLVIAEKIPMDASLDMTAKLRSLQAAGVKGVIIQNVAVPTLNLIRAYSAAGATMQLYGLNWTVNEDMIRLAGPALNGFIYAAATAFPDENLPGLEEIRAARNTPISRSMKYVQGWATARVLFEGLRLAGPNPTGEQVKAALERLNGFSTGGIFDAVTFTPASHMGVHRLRLYQFQSAQNRFSPITDYLSGR